MCPENANVFIVEDNKPLRETFEALLPFDGHKVVVSASTMKEALEAIDHLEELGVQVAIVDGNLSEDDFSCADGVEISEAIRAHSPATKIIHNSSKEFGGPCDVDFRKGQNPQLKGQSILDLVKSL
jgi:CheY-like chemotaxis protein